MGEIRNVAQKSLSLGAKVLMLPDYQRIVLNFELC